MKKHFIGIALFVFIVGISSFAAGLFVQIPKPEIFEVTKTAARYESRTRCFEKYRNKKADLVTPQVTQAVYNEKTRLFSADFLINRGNSSSNTSCLLLHFFVKDADETHYLVTERIFLKPNFADEKDKFVSIFSSFESLNQSSNHKNLYVIAEPYRKAKSFIYKKPEFDENKAVAVLFVND